MSSLTYLLIAVAVFIPVFFSAHVFRVFNNNKQSTYRRDTGICDPFHIFMLSMFISSFWVFTIPAIVAGVLLAFVIRKMTRLADRVGEAVYKINKKLKEES